MFWITKFPELARAREWIVACSGGPDSLALALTAKSEVQACSADLSAFIVDHGMREGSDRDAKAAQTELRGIGIKSRILRVVESGHQIPRSMEGARRVRYDLLASAIRERSARYPSTSGSSGGSVIGLLGHHAHDEAETMLMRLERGASLASLAGMRPSFDWQGVRFVRPFLALAPWEFRGCLAAGGVKPLRDPANQNLCFERARARAALAELSPLGFHPAAWAEAGRRLREADQALAWTVRQVLPSVCRFAPALGVVAVDRKALRDLPRELGLRILANLIYAVSGAHRWVRLRSLEAFYAAWVEEDNASRGTGLLGCLVRPFCDLSGRENLLFCREPRLTEMLRLMPDVTFPSNVVWDGRFEVTLAAPEPDGLLHPGRVGILGARCWVTDDLPVQDDGHSLGAQDDEKTALATCTSWGLSSVRLREMMASLPLARQAPWVDQTERSERARSGRKIRKADRVRDPLRGRYRFRDLDYIGGFRVFEVRSLFMNALEQAIGGTYGETGGRAFDGAWQKMETKIG